MHFVSQGPNPGIADIPLHIHIPRDRAQQGAVVCMHMADTDQLLKDLQAAVSGSSDAGADVSKILDTGTRARARVAQEAEDLYWTPRHQLEEAIAARQTASARAAAAEDRIAQLKQQLGN